MYEKYTESVVQKPAGLRLKFKVKAKKRFIGKVDGKKSTIRVKDKKYS